MDLRNKQKKKKKTKQVYQGYLSLLYVDSRNKTEEEGGLFQGKVEEEVTEIQSSSVCFSYQSRPSTLNPLKASEPLCPEPVGEQGCSLCSCCLVRG